MPLVRLESAWAFDPPRFLPDGATVHTEISGIGALTNRAAAE
jgi:2-keto-4-pentenoate hydratase/2-oxohepta-3-ene-1,7-dioic acid hydratase in catechol pathway